MAKKSLTFVLTVVLLLFLFGCTNSDPNADKQKESMASKPSLVNEPITLTIYQGAAFTADDFQKFMAEPVKKKYPNISMDMVFKEDAKMTHEEMLNQLITSNNIPDILYVDGGGIRLAKGLGLTFDLSQMAKSDNFDFNRIDENALDTLRMQGSNLYAIPFSTYPLALFYNKDIFDKFGVSYPKDGLTWPDVIDLGKKLEREDSGTKYRGLAPGAFDNMSSPLSLPLVDSKTGQASLQLDGWKKALEVYKEIMDLSDDKSGGIIPFFQNRNIAMLPNTINIISNIQDVINKGITFNWDVAQFPSYSDKPDVGHQPVINALGITANSKHKEAAFQVISYLTSNDVQKIVSRNGRASILKDQEIKKVFGEDISGLKGKNTAGILKSIPAKPVPASEYDNLVAPILSKAVTTVIQGKSDINTALQQAEEEANKAIGAAKANNPPEIERKP